MDAATKYRLRRLLDELAEIEDRREALFGFGVFTPPEDGHFRCGWGRLDDARVRRHKSQKLIPLQPAPWLDPSPGNSCCIRWWGHRGGIAAFQSWVVRLGALLSRDQPAPTVSVVEDSVIPGLRIASAAEDTPRTFTGSPHYHDAILDMVRAAADSRGLKVAVTELSPDGGDFYDVQQWGLRFVRAFGLHVLGLGQCRLQINVERNEVTFDGHTFFPDLTWVRVLTLLAEAQGNPLTRRALKAQDEIRYPTLPVLRDEERLDRLIGRIKQKGIPVLTSKLGYSLPPDCLPDDLGSHVQPLC